MKLSQDDLEQMLHKGMGRAILYLKGQDLTEYRDLILDNCLNDYAYEQQCEDNRAKYLYPLISQSSDAEFYRDEIVKALGEENDKYSYDQIFDLAGLFALDGDECARLAMYERFERNIASDSTGASSIVKVDRVDGLIYVLQQFDKLSDEDFDDDWSHYIWIAEDQLSVEGVSLALRKAAEQNPEIAYLLAKLEPEYSPFWSPEEIVQRREEESERYFANLETVEDMTWEEARSHKDFNEIAVRWARVAPDNELLNAAEDFLEEDDFDRIKKFLMMFWVRPFPLHPRKLIGLINSPSFQVTVRAIRSLAKVRHDDVRALFHRLYEDPEWEYCSLELLRSNYKYGDHILIERLMDKVNDENYLHSICRDVLKVYEENDVPESIGPLMKAYEKTPCSFCRNSMFELLNELHTIPDWMIEECLYDADEDTRKLARELWSEKIG